MRNAEVVGEGVLSGRAWGCVEVNDEIEHAPPVSRC